MVAHVCVLAYAELQDIAPRTANPAPQHPESVCARLVFNRSGGVLTIFQTLVSTGPRALQILTHFILPPALQGRWR